LPRAFFKTATIKGANTTKRKEKSSIGQKTETESEYIMIATKITHSKNLQKNLRKKACHARSYGGEAEKICTQPAPWPVEGPSSQGI